jgi:hypothetical protein
VGEAGASFAGVSSTCRHTPPHPARPLAQSGGLEVPSSNLGAPTEMKVVQNLMFWRRREQPEHSEALPTRRRNGEPTRSSAEIVLNPDALDSKGTPETQSESAERRRREHEKRGEEPPNY